MPRNWAKDHKAAKRGDVLASDIRLVDFANASLASVDSSRIAKPAATAAAQALLRDAKNWYECELSELLADLEIPGEKQETDEESCENQVTAKQVGKIKSVGGLSTGGSDSETVYSDYPDDLWFLISNYIPPELVGKFAAISNATAEIVSRPGFWRRLYKRYYKQRPDLDERYSAEAMHRQYGLRTCIIKALYHVYQPFVDRVKSSSVVLSPEVHHIAKLCRGRCAATWHQTSTGPHNRRQFEYFIKFHGATGLNPQELILMDNASNSSRSQQGGAGSSKEDNNPWTVRSQRLAALSNIWANTQSGACVLKVVCSQFVAVPNVIGWRLHELSVGLGEDMCRHRLKLSFVNASASYRSNYETPKLSSRKPVSARKVSSAQSQAMPCQVVIMDGMLQLHILDWWHPAYPIDVV